MSDKSIMNKQLRRIELEVRVGNLRDKIKKIQVKQGGLQLKNIELKDKIRGLHFRLNSVEKVFKKRYSYEAITSRSISLEEKTILIHREVQSRIVTIQENLQLLRRRKVEIKERKEALINRFNFWLNK
jgi:hypothetical protein